MYPRLLPLNGNVDSSYCHPLSSGPWALALYSLLSWAGLRKFDKNISPSFIPGSKILATIDTQEKRVRKLAQFPDPESWRSLLGQSLCFQEDEAEKIQN